MAGCGGDELTLLEGSSKLFSGVWFWLIDVSSVLLSLISIGGADCGNFLGVDVSTLLVGDMLGNVNVSTFTLGVDGMFAMTVGVLYLFTCI